MILSIVLKQDQAQFTRHCLILDAHNIPLITDWNDWFGRGGIITVLRPKWYRILFANVETYYEEAYRKKVRGLQLYPQL